ncbi:MAG: hypothetical protein HC882_08020 [Acidobacteria bacterium]|nr:hypothetical protein [Acidobacteriota bacterium]
MDKKTRTIAERAEVAADQLLEAAKSGDVMRVRSVLAYWFGIVYDEGMQHARALAEQPPLKATVERLREMNDQLQRRESQTVLPAVKPRRKDPRRED